MKKLIIVLTLLVAFLFPELSKADADVFVNLGIGVGIPAPVFIAPSPVVYAVPTFASASLVSRISPNTFLSLSIGIPAPVFIAPAPVVVAPPFVTFPVSTVVVEPAPVIIHSGPQHINVHQNIHVNSHGGPPGHYKVRVKHRHK